MMKKKKNKKLTRLIMVLGILLIAASAVTVVFTQTAQKSAAEEARQTAEYLLTLMPEIQAGAPDGRTDTQMPVIELEGTDFAGVVEVPVYDTMLPMGNTWSRHSVSKHPCRFSGSPYDSSLILGGSGNQGQFDFMKWITGGDLVTVTDMTGLRFSYLVSDVLKTKDVSSENLLSMDADLVLFAGNGFSADYTVVLCHRK